MTTEFYKKLSELTKKALKYKPINEKEAEGKKLKHIYKLGSGWSYEWVLITFTDDTGLYYHVGYSYPETHINLVASYQTPKKQVRSYLTELGSTLQDADLLNSTEELLEAEKQYRLAYIEEPEQLEINKLKEKLKQLEG